MKKYIVPQVDVREAECTTIIALSLQSGSADESEVLGKEEVTEWDIWQAEE